MRPVWSGKKISTRGNCRAGAGGRGEKACGNGGGKRPIADGGYPDLRLDLEALGLAQMIGAWKDKRLKSRQALVETAVAAAPYKPGLGSRRTCEHRQNEGDEGEKDQPQRGE